MIEENKVLRLLFPECYWKTECRDPYDFKGNFELMKSVLKAYVMGVELDVGNRMDSQIALGSKVLNALVGSGFKEELVISTHDERFTKAVYDFFCLGKDLQERGLSPYIEISW